MCRVIWVLLLTLRSTFRSRQALVAENAALRHQVATLSGRNRRPRLTAADRVFWVVLRQTWRGWRDVLVLVRPETVVAWHRRGFRLFWTWKSGRSRPGRPRVDAEIRALVQRMATENTGWGAPRIHGELLKLGVAVSERTVSRLMPRGRRGGSQSWRTFLKNHVGELASMDFFVLPTITFRLLFILVILRHERRQIVHTNLTAHPTAAWTARQVVEAFPWDTAPRYVLRDRDRVYGEAFQRRVAAMGVEQMVTAPRSPWQNPYVERFIGSARRECFDHAVVLGERHARHLLRRYVDYYERSRTHLSLAKDTPAERQVQPATMGRVVAIPNLGGLHHRYERRAA